MPTLPSNATRDAARTAQERKLAVIAEVDLDRCANVYGVSPCTAGRIHTGTAQAGAAGTLTLAAGASGSDDFYNNKWLRIHTGAGSAQERKIADYTGSSKVAAVSPRWRQNLRQRSEELDDAYWSKFNNATVDDNALSVEGGALLADKLIEGNNTNGFYALSRNDTKAASALRYVLAVRAKAAERSEIRVYADANDVAQNASRRFNLLTGALGTSTTGGTFTLNNSGIEALGNGEYLCWIDFTTGTQTSLRTIFYLTSGGTEDYDGDGVSGAYFWKAHLEQTALGLGEYIKTISAIVALPDNTSQYHVIDRPGACYNTRVTCQDSANYVKGVKTYRFGMRGAPIPPASAVSTTGEIARPYITAADAAVSVIDIEEGLARRNSLKLTLIDEPDSDLEQDLYAADRATPPQGTFWARLVARNPNSAGRFVRVRRGYALQPWSWLTFLDELYTVERLDGPNGKGEVELTLKDPLKLTDRTNIPAATDGKQLAELKDYAFRGLATSASATTVVLVGDASAADDTYNGLEIFVAAGTGSGQRRTITDYVGESRTATVSAWLVQPDATSQVEISALSVALTSGKGAQYADPATSGKREFVRIGEEIIEYTAKSGDTLSWDSSASRAQFGTERKTHSAGAQVQLCRAFFAQPVTAVVQSLMEEGGVPTAQIDTAALAAAEADWYGEAFHVTCCLSEPETASALLQELLPQISAVLYWSAQTQKAIFQTVLPKLGTPAAANDTQNFLEGSIDIDVLEELRLTYVALYYAQANATSNRREAKNYALGEIAIDTDAESPNEYADRRTDLVYSRWFGPANGIAARAYVGRKLAGLRDAPRRISVRLDPKDYVLPAGELTDVTTRYLTDVAGAPKTTRCLITKVEDKGVHIAVEARTTGFAKRYGFISGNSAGNYPSDPTYAHISDNAGLMGNGDPGYLII